VLGVPVVVPHIRETTALGAARLAAVGIGRWTQRDVTRTWRADVRYEPRMDAADRDELLDGWHRAVARSRGWAS
jgi:glycerol kinase